jgi:hypothetical protein
MMMILGKASITSRLRYRKSSTKMSTQGVGIYPTPKGCLRGRSKNDSKCWVTGGCGWWKRAITHSQSRLRRRLHDVCLPWSRSRVSIVACVVCVVNLT